MARGQQPATQVDSIEKYTTAIAAKIKRFLVKGGHLVMCNYMGYTLFCDLWLQTQGIGQVFSNWFEIRYSGATR